jgi:hypothetical protein
VLYERLGLLPGRPLSPLGLTGSRNLTQCPFRLWDVWDNSFEFVHLWGYWNSGSLGSGILLDDWATNSGTLTVRRLGISLLVALNDLGFGTLPNSSESLWLLRSTCGN